MSISRVFRAAIALTIISAWVSTASAGDPSGALQRLEFLAGTWQSKPSETSRGSSGTATFAFSLDAHLLTRTSNADSPASGTRPASHHEDRMMMYCERDSLLRADYVDNEGHAIHYTVTLPTPHSAVFISDDTAAGPQYRLTYDLVTSDELRGTFEIAPPGSHGQFKVYLSWSTERKQ